MLLPVVSLVFDCNQFIVSLLVSKTLIWNKVKLGLVEFKAFEKELI